MHGNYGNYGNYESDVGASRYTPWVCVATVWNGAGDDVPLWYAGSVMAAGECVLRWRGTFEYPVGWLAAVWIGSGARCAVAVCGQRDGCGGMRVTVARRL